MATSTKNEYYKDYYTPEIKQLWNDVAIRLMIENDSFLTADLIKKSSYQSSQIENDVEEAFKNNFDSGCHYDDAETVEWALLAHDLYSTNWIRKESHEIIMRLPFDVWFDAAKPFLIECMENWLYEYSVPSDDTEGLAKIFAKNYWKLCQESGWVGADWNDIGGWFISCDPFFKQLLRKTVTGFLNQLDEKGIYYLDSENFNEEDDNELPDDLNNIYLGLFNILVQPVIDAKPTPTKTFNFFGKEDGEWYLQWYEPEATMSIEEAMEKGNLLAKD